MLAPTTSHQVSTRIQPGETAHSNCGSPYPNTIAACAYKSKKPIYPILPPANPSGTPSDLPTPSASTSSDRRNATQSDTTASGSATTEYLSFRMPPWPTTAGALYPSITPQTAPVTVGGSSLAADNTCGWSWQLSLSARSAWQARSRKTTGSLCSSACTSLSTDDHH